ncbi:GTP 3',8-cyclase MoaA [Caldalkalibacillus mannanilyticus]|uniref:GTP 3',8-cyclase MoaA n=1 Tax=Caldalkalibacillus mannanilyticus TaxID=1418 RepID=UPI000468A6D2|nr:GTP 3',8-cyclase MoaA [Caldalkalibacillus mannanilyticus]
MDTKIEDRLQRPLRDIRISVTDKCNFRCSYCMPAEIFGPDYPFLPQNELLTFEEISKLVKLFHQLGVEKVRLTGGEPLLRKNLERLIEMISNIDGINDIALTTNGSLLAEKAKLLREAGLQRVTVSVDSLCPERFQKINGRNFPLEKVLRGIDAAAAEGLEVKINMVVKKGVNDQDIVPMAKFFNNKGYTLRFIEFMDVGNHNDWKLDEVVPSKDIVALINKEMPIEPVNPNYFGEVASRYRYIGTDREIGFISSVTEAFCSSCTRARLSANGHLYTCLFSSQGYNLKTPLREQKTYTELLELIQGIWSQRKDRYSEERLTNTKLRQKKIEMSHIGG